LEVHRGELDKWVEGTGEFEIACNLGSVRGRTYATVHEDAAGTSGEQLQETASPNRATLRGREAFSQDRQGNRTAALLSYCHNIRGTNSPVAAEAPVIVYDLSVAEIEVLERCPLPIAVAHWAVGLECITARPNILAALRIWTTRRPILSVIILSAIPPAISFCSAAEVPVVVYDSSIAPIKILEWRAMPATVAGLAFGLECTATRTDLPAGLGIRTIRGATLLTISTLAISTLAISCFAAHEASIIVLDFPGALVEILEWSSIPSATSGLAISLERAAARADLLACQRIPATRHTLPAVSTLPVVPTHVAAEAAVIIHDFAGATLKIWKLGGLPIPIAVLTISLQRRSIHSYVSTGLPVRTRRNFLRGAGGPRATEGYGQCDHSKRT
jgi:hypothetical protein